MRNARIFSLSLACIVALSYAQNVGIGTAAPTERLHVAGNLRLDNAFMPGNQPGAVGNLLLSQGPGVAPVWLPNGSAGSILMSTGPGSNPIWAPNPICNTPTLYRFIKFTSTSPTQVCNTTLAENATNQIWNAGDGPASPFAGDKFSIYGTAANPWAINGYTAVNNAGGVYGEAAGANGRGVQGQAAGANGVGGVFLHTAAPGTGVSWGAVVVSCQRGGNALAAHLSQTVGSYTYLPNTTISAYHSGGVGPTGQSPRAIFASVESGDNNAEAIRGQHTNGTTNVNAYAVLGFMNRGANSAGTNWAVGVYGYNPRTGTNDWAVYSNGWFGATNKAFLIDHPLDPENKYLLHFSAEGPEPYNIYRGVVVTDANGYAEVELPAYFSAANKEPSYYLTPIGTFAQAIVEREVQNNRFAIRTDKPNVKVSWVVLATRDDAYARYYHKPTEFEKEPRHRGKYINPYVYGKDESYGIFPGAVQPIERKVEKSLKLQEIDPRK